MELNTTRELARIAAILHLVSEQSDSLNDLADIQAFRDLDDSLQEVLDEAVGRDLVPKDPLAVVRQDWLRLVEWNNHVQGFLRSAKELGSQLDEHFASSAIGTKKQKNKKDDWKPTREELEKMRSALEVAPHDLRLALEKARDKRVTDDWEKGKPYSELVEVADAMGWEETLELSDSPVESTSGVSPRELPLIVSSLAVDESSPSLNDKLNLLALRLERTNQLLDEHASHSIALNEIQNLIEAGEIESARRNFNQLSPLFSDLSYSEAGNQLKKRETRLASISQLLKSSSERIESLAERIKAFVFIPPIGLSNNSKSAIDEAQKVIEQANNLEEEGRSNEWNERLHASTSELKTTVQEFQSTSMRRVRQRVIFLSGFWFMIFLSVSVGVVNWNKQQNEQKRLAAEAEAEVEAAAKAKAEAAAKAKAEVEAAAKAKAEAAAKAKAEVEAAAKAKAELEAAAKAKAKAEFFTKLNMEMIPIPAGTFVMGSPPDEDGRFPDEDLQTTVTITKPFWLGKTEVTQSQWKAVMGNNPSLFTGDDLPVVNVDWHDAVAFCEKLNEMKRDTLPAGYRYTLPTEAQWEYACRAGTTTRFYHGDDPDYIELEKYAWYRNNSSRKIHPFGGKLPNGWVLYDMYGNVLEWCLDWKGDFTGGSVSDPQGPQSGTYRVLRSGCMLDLARRCRSALRTWFRPDDSGSYLGFRVALSSVPSE